MRTAQRQRLLSERLDRDEAAVLAALARETTRLYGFEDGSSRVLIIDPLAQRFYVVFREYPDPAVGLALRSRAG